MARSLALFLRLSVIASAAAMLVFSVAAARAQDFQQAPNSNSFNGPSAAPTQPVQQEVFGYNPGQGVPHKPGEPTPIAAPAAAPFVPAQSYGYTPQAYSAPQAYGPPQAYSAPQPYSAPPVYAPQAPMQPSQPYGYVPMRGAPPVQGQMQAQQQPYGYAPQTYAPQAMAQNYQPTSYGTQQVTDPNAYYQAPSNGMQRANMEYRLGAGDKVRVSVFGETDLSGEYQIDGSGLVRLPLIGTVRAAGLNAPALENAIAGALGNGYLKQPRVNVEIITYRPFYIIGAVNRPGQYPYVDNMSALNAVGLAGGFTDQAVKSEIYVRHEGSTIEATMPTDELTHLAPGDVIRVKTTLFWDAMSVLQPLAPAAFAAAAIR